MPLDYYIDWNCRLMPAIKGSVQSPEDSVSAMLELSQKFHLTRFCMMPEFDPLSESVSMFLLRRDQSKRILCDMLPKELKVIYAAGRISALLQEKKTVLLGTSLNTVGKIFHYDLEYYQKSAMDFISVADYQRMLHANRVFWDL